MDDAIQRMVFNKRKLIQKLNKEIETVQQQASRKTAQLQERIRIAQVILETLEPKAEK